MAFEAHPVIRINFALWCQSGVVQLNMGDLIPIYSRCNKSTICGASSAITEIIFFNAVVYFYRLLWLLQSLSNSTSTYTWHTRQELASSDNAGRSQNQQRRGWCLPSLVLVAAAVLRSTQGQLPHLQHATSVHLGQGRRRCPCSRYCCPCCTLLE